MGEILLKAKRKDNGGWVEGYYVRLYDSKGNVSHRIYPGYAESDCGEFYPDWYEVDPETVGQCSFLPDKNGKKIFEGDIIKITWKAQGREPVSHICSITYIKSGFFTEKDGRLKGQLSNYICDSVGIRTEGIFVEVIGNVHDDSELLKM